MMRVFNPIQGWARPALRYLPSAGACLDVSLLFDET